jgi:hypothetical protein
MQTGLKHHRVIKKHRMQKQQTGNYFGDEHIRPAEFATIAFFNNDLL